MTDGSSAAAGSSAGTDRVAPRATSGFHLTEPFLAPALVSATSLQLPSAVSLPGATLDAPVTVIDTRAGYLAAVDLLRTGSGPVAVDAERASGFRYSQRAYLIQVHRRQAGTFLFDPPAIGDFTALNDAIADDEWVLHAASQDLACLREVGLNPARIFDTELAARLLGYARVGLAAVVEELLGLHLAKEHSAADWSRRPLPPSWLVYAALDVQLLVDVRDAMAAQLTASAKDRIAEEEFQAVLDREVRQVRSDPWRRLSGLHAVRGARGLAVARELWTARDELARELDTSPGRLIPDASLVAAARILPTSKRDLAALREFTGRTSRSELDRWWTAIERGLATGELPQVRPPGDALPPPRVWAEKNPEADRRFKAARLAVIQRAEDLVLPVENLLTPDLLRRISWSPPTAFTDAEISAALAALGARPWQRNATAAAIAEAFVVAHQSATEAPEAAS